jgi:hypothetical protein
MSAVCASVAFRTSFKKKKKKFKYLFLGDSKSDLIQTWTDRKALVQSFFFRRQGFRHGYKISENSNFKLFNSECLEK